MGEHTKIPLTFGGGLDRATGIFDVAPTSFSDLRNCYIYRNRLEARKGLASANSFVDHLSVAMDDVVLIQAMRSEQMGIVVTWQQNHNELDVYRVDSDGSGTDKLGAWGTLPANAHEPPRVIATEIYRKILLAHDEVVFARRLSTYYYDPFAGTQLVQLTADLDGGGSAPLYFRGVTTHLNYAFGWGFGTASEQSRPEIVRVSKAGDPTDWTGDHFFIAGIRDDPVLACHSLGTVPSPIAVFKENETYQIFGYDRRSFGIRRIDEIYGIAASRLGISYNGLCYFWSLEGPRVTDGSGPSRDLSWPLDLDAPTPTDLVAEGALADGFAEYLPGRRVIQFIFGKRCYNLSLWDPSNPKWSYGELGYETFCGGRLSSGGTSQSTAPGAAPSAVTAPGKTGTTTTITVDWTNNSIDGDEFVEIWMKEESQSWVRHPPVLALGGTQNTDVAGLTAGKDHEVALRYRRGPYYSPSSSDSSDPSTWPAAQQATGGTLPAAPVLDSTSWDRVDAGNEKNILNWTNTHADKQTKVYRDGGLITTVAAGVATYDDTAAVGETDEVYKLRHVTAGGDSVDSNSLTQWTGPDVPPVLDTLTDGGLAYAAFWTNGDGSLKTEVWSSLEFAGYVLDVTKNAGVTSASETPAGGVNDDNCDVKVRHKKTEFAVDDFSKYSNIKSVTLTDGA